MSSNPTPTPSPPFSSLLTSGSSVSRRSACDALSQIVSDSSVSPPFLDSSLVACLEQQINTALPDAPLLQSILSCLLAISQLDCSLIPRSCVSCLLSLLNSPSFACLDPPERDLALSPLFALLTNIAESSECGDALNHEPLIHAALVCLPPGSCSRVVQIECSQFLLSLTEQNPWLTDKLRATPGLAAMLIALTSTTDVSRLVRACSAGLAIQLMPEQQIDALWQQGNDPQAEAIVSSLVQLFSFSCTEAFHHFELAIGSIHQHFQSIVAPAAKQTDEKQNFKSLEAEGEETQEQEADNGQYHAAEREFHQSLDSAVFSFREQLLASKMAMEILTNFCSLPDEMEENSQGSAQFEADNENGDSASAPSNPMQHAIARANVIAVAIKFLEQCTDKLPETLRSQLNSSRLLDSLSELMQQNRQAAINTILNLLLAADWSAEALAAIRAIAFQRIQTLLSTERPNSGHLDELDTLAQIVWHACRKSRPDSLDRGSLALACKLSSLDQSPQVRLSACGLLGVLGRWPTLANSVPIIALALRDRIDPAKENDPNVVAEAVNSLIDLFSEDDVFDQTYKQIGMQTRLQQCAQHITQALKVDRHRQRDETLRLNDTLINLKEFIRYKEKRI